MKLKLSLDEKQMDVRLVDRLLAEGKITQKDYQDYLSKLEDSTDGADFSDTKAPASH